jgi:hypothetical protein
MHALLNVLEAGLADVDTAVPARNDRSDADSIVRAQRSEQGRARTVLPVVVMCLA